MIQYDYENLKERIKEMCESVDVFCRDAKMTPDRLYTLLSGQDYWTIPEIENAAITLGIGSEAISRYFFCVK